MLYSAVDYLSAWHQQNGTPKWKGIYSEIMSRWHTSRTSIATLKWMFKGFGNVRLYMCTVVNELEPPWLSQSIAIFAATAAVTQACNPNPRPSAGSNRISVAPRSLTKRLVLSSGIETAECCIETLRDCHLCLLPDYCVYLKKSINKLRKGEREGKKGVMK